MSNNPTKELLDYEYIPERLERAATLALRGQIHSDKILLVMDSGEVKERKLGVLTHVDSDTSIAWCNTEPNVWVLVKIPLYLYHITHEIRLMTFTDEQIAITKLGGSWITMIMDENKKIQENAK